LPYLIPLFYFSPFKILAKKIFLIPLYPGPLPPVGGRGDKRKKSLTNARNIGNSRGGGNLWASHIFEDIFEYLFA
jgi:hypothetical protein